MSYRGKKRRARRNRMRARLLYLFNCGHRRVVKTPKAWGRDWICSVSWVCELCAGRVDTLGGIDAGRGLLIIDDPYGPG